MKSCLILSDGPVPAPEHDVVEGGGLRCWGLAKGIAANNTEIKITVAYNDTRKKEKFTSRYEGIDISTWCLEGLSDIISRYDTVIVSYCMGELTQRAVDAMRPDQQLILDCYVPIYVEASARESDNLTREYHDFHNEVGRFAHALRRGDLFLCASEQQKKFYQGVLSAVGRVNPATYNEDLILIVPYGIYREAPVAKSMPITDLIGRGTAKTYKKLLWFGGIYPWFDLKNLVSAVIKANDQVPTKLIIVGAKNPFNTHPDFLRKYDELVDFIKDNNAENDVILHDWASFNDRADWYLDSDAVIVINKPGPENELAWRTRLVDFTWANLPIITNGGDPLGERLIAMGAAERLSGLEPEDISSDLKRLFKNDKHLHNLQEKLIYVRTDLYWDVVTKPLADQIKIHARAKDLAEFGIYSTITAPGGSASRVRKLVVKISRVPQYLRKHGLRNTYIVISTILIRKISRKLIAGNKKMPRIVVVSHQLDMSGGPFVIMDFARQLKELYPEKSLEFYTFNPAHSQNIVTLNKMGIKPKILADRNAIIDFRKGDVVVLNTTAHSNQLKASIFHSLDRNEIKKLFWYSHEDEPKLIFTRQETIHIQKLMHQKKLTLLVPAKKIYDEYKKHFGASSDIVLQPYKLVTDKKYHRTLRAADFSKKISFILPGTVGDGRKGQLPLLYAFISFYQRYYKQNASDYRDFELVFVGMTDDFLSRQILNHADSSLAGRFKSYGRVTKNQHLDILLKSNMTLCYSLREALPLFVFEGMTAGHPILRNDSSGVDEQLEAGKNGFLLDSKDFDQVVKTIERVLNKSKTSDKSLALMSTRSYKIAASQEKNTYKPMADMVVETFDGK